jgi:bifunctional non-homologous end joining protein LigD
MPLPVGFIPPCLATKAPQPPTGDMWVHEIKHDGFRVIARKDGDRVRLYSRPGNSLTDRFPLIVEALLGLRSRSCIIDGEAVCCDHKGVPSFDRLRYRRHDTSVFMYAFDLIELNGDDLRREPLDIRKATLASLLKRATPRPAVERAHRSRWPHRFRPCLPDGLGGHRVEAQVVDVPLRPLTGLAQEQEPSVRGGAAGGGRRLGEMSRNLMTGYFGSASE